MSAIDWWKVKPSSSPPLSWAEVLALPPGMVVLEETEEGSTLPLLVLESDAGGARRARMWRLNQRWSLKIPFRDIPDVKVYLPRLPRLSFALTTDAVRERRKTVTRRLSLPTWWKEGAWFLGVDKIRQAGAQGLCVAQCGPANREPLVAISKSEVVREGFETTPEGFCAMFRSTAPRSWDGWIWRLPFAYLEIPE